MCFIDSGHLLIQLLLSPPLFVDAHRQASRAPEETFSEVEISDIKGRTEGKWSSAAIFQEKAAGLSADL